MTGEDRASKLPIVTGLVRVIAAAAILIGIVAGVAQPRALRRCDAWSYAFATLDDGVDDGACVPDAITVVEPIRQLDIAHLETTPRSQVRTERVLVIAPKTSPPPPASRVSLARS